MGGEDITTGHGGTENRRKEQSNKSQSVQIDLLRMIGSSGLRSRKPGPQWVLDENFVSSVSPWFTPLDDLKNANVSTHFRRS